MFSLFKENDTIVGTSPYAGKNSEQFPNRITWAFQGVFSLGNCTKAESDQKNIAHLGDVFIFFPNMESLDTFAASCPDRRPGSIDNTQLVENVVKMPLYRVRTGGENICDPRI